jgi:hypothetical protein
MVYVHTHIRMYQAFSGPGVQLVHSEVVFAVFGQALSSCIVIVPLKLLDYGF